MELKALSKLHFQRLFTRDVKTDCIAYSLMGGIFIVRFIYIGSMNLVADEAYYWDWSRHPAFGYFDHPPMVAWLIFAFVKLLGATPLGVKCGAIVCSLFASVCAYLLARKYIHRRLSLILYVLLSSSVVLYGIGSLLATPDVPMVACWSMGMLAAYKMIFEHSPYAWIGLGCAIGFGMMSKYSFALFIVSLFIFLLCFKGHRNLLVSRHFLGALFIAVVIFFPNIFWNSHNDWVSVLFQLRHGIGLTGFPRWNFLGDYFGGQAGLLSIFPFFIILWSAVHELRFHMNEAKRAFLLLFFAVPFLFFAFSSLQKRVEPNWSCGAYISGLILIPLLLESIKSPFKKILQWIVGFSLIISVSAVVVIMAHIKHPFLPLPAIMDPTMQLHGWKHVNEGMQSLRESIDPSGGLRVCTNSYQDAALFAFHLPDHPSVLSLNINSRANQYSLWGEHEQLKGQKVLFISGIDDSCTLHASVSSGFDSLKCAGIVARRPDDRIKILYGFFIAKVR